MIFSFEYDDNSEFPSTTECIVSRARVTVRSRCFEGLDRAHQILEGSGNCCRHEPIFAVTAKSGYEVEYIAEFHITDEPHREKIVNALYAEKASA